MTVLLDDGVIYLVYLLMTIAIIGLFTMAFFKYKEAQKAAEDDMADEDDPDKLTSNKRVDPAAKSRYNEFD